MEALALVITGILLVHDMLLSPKLIASWIFMEMWQLFPESWELSVLNTKLQKSLHICHNWQCTHILPFDIMQSVHLIWLCLMCFEIYIFNHCVFETIIYAVLYSSPNIVRVVKSRRMRWAGHVAHMEEGRGVHKVLVGKPEGKRPLGRPRRRWEDNIKMDLQEVRMGCGDWMELAKDRDRWWVLVSTVMNFRVP